MKSRARHIGKCGGLLHKEPALRKSATTRHGIMPLNERFVLLDGEQRPEREWARGLEIFCRIWHRSQHLA